MKKNFTKKFLKKNILLQQNLENFLNWREKRKKSFVKKEFYNSNLISSKLSNNLQAYSKFDSTNTSKKKSLKKFYQPVYLKTGKNLKIKSQTVFFAEFFPHKKPFMNLWIFPLLGGCFLSLLTLNKETFNSSSPKILKGMELPLSQNPLLPNLSKKFSFNKKYISGETGNLQNLSEMTSFSANYKEVSKNREQKNLLKTNSLSLELENLCFFYLNLTNQDLKPSSTHLLIGKKNQQLFLQKELQKVNDLKNTSKFDWIWHSLKLNTNPMLLTSNLKTIDKNLNSLVLKKDSFYKMLEFNLAPGFPQKMKNINLNLDLTKSTLKSSSSHNFRRLVKNIPHISYYEAAILLDQWLNLLTMNANSLEFLKSIETITNNSAFKKLDLKTTEKITFLESLEKIYVVENLLSKNSKNSTFLIQEFYQLLDLLTKNKLNLKNSYFQMNSKLTNLEWKKLNDFLTQHSINSTENTKTNSPKNLLKNSQDFYRFYLTKIFLTNYFHNISNLRVYTKPQTYSSKSSSTLIKNQSVKFRKLNSIKFDLEKDRLLKNSNQDNLVTVNYLELSKNKFKKILNYSVFLKFIKQSSILTNKTIPPLTKIQSVSMLKEFTSSNNQKLNENKLNNVMYELLLLQYWKNFFPEMYKLSLFNTTSRFSKLQVFKNYSLFEKTNQRFGFDLFKKNLSLTNVTEKFVQEMTLYRRLNTVSKKFIHLNFFRQMNRTHFIENKKIFKYKTPILLPTIDPLKFYSRSFFENDNLLKEQVKKSTERFTKTPFSNRNLLPWFEIAPKQNNLSSSPVFYQKSSFNSLNSPKKLKKIHTTKEPFLQKLLSEYKLKKFLSLNYLNQFHNYLYKSQFLKTKTFSIIKKFNNVNSDKFYFLRPITSKPSSSFKTNIKYFKSKNVILSRQPNSLLENRKAERIFRTYFSVKSVDKQGKLLQNRELNQQSNLTKQPVNSFQYFRKAFFILKDLKKQVKIKKLLQIPHQNLFIMQSKNKKFIANIQKQKTLKSLFARQINQKLKSPKVFSSNDFLKKLGGHLKFLKKSDFSLNDFEIKRLEKRKTLQKKRRLKKLKLENRRRKKRKRFFPRPTYLRFQLYYSFLQKRHSPKLKKDFYDSSPINSGLKQMNSPQIVCTQFLNKKIRAFYLQKKIYRQQKQRWGSLSSNLLVNEKSFLKKRGLMWTVPTYHQQEFYKISNETLTEFERLCWKSYWLRSNLTPYIRRIQKNLKKMQANESLKESKQTFSQILENLISWPIFNNQNKLFDAGLSVNYYQIKNVTPVYLNVKETLDNSFFHTSSLTNFKILENKAEYNRLIYERITDEIKNVKSQLNVDGQNHARSYKTGRQKIEKVTPKNKLTSLNLFTNNFLQPKVQAFSVFSTSDSSIKPFGDLPTLRLLWACNKTNLFTYHQNNLTRNLWTTYKNREQTKNNKTKKFVSKIYKNYNLIPKTLDTMSFNKTKLASQKIQSFGGFIYGKNYNSYLRSLKFQLQTKQKSLLKLMKTYENTNSSQLSFFLNKSSVPRFDRQKTHWFENFLTQKPQKRMNHFWWSTRQINPMDHIFSLWSSSSQSFSNLDFYIQESTNSIFQNENLKTFPPIYKNQVSVPREKNVSDLKLKKNIILTTFWVCCLLFHVSILFTVIRIPEIRSLAKFQFLLLSKLANGYLLCLFSIHDLFKEYKTKIHFLLKKSVSFIEKKSNYLTFLEMKSSFEELGSNMNNQSTRISYKNFFLTNQTSIYEKSKLKSKKLVQSTIQFHLNFRDFLHVEKITGNLFENSLKNKVNLLFSHSINPSFRKFKSPPVLNTKFLNPKNNWFYSWYSGFLWYIFSTSSNAKMVNKQQFEKSLLFHKKDFYLKETVSNSKKSTSLLVEKNVTSSKQNFSAIIQSNIQIQSILSLFTLYLTKSIVKIFYFCFNLFYKFLFKMIDLMEGLLLIFYKFLEKPAELMVDWIAEIFLIEWSSNLTTYVPEVFDTNIWNSMTKFSRSTRPLGGVLFGFIYQKVFLGSVEIFYSWVVKPDTDLIIRQKKGVIFWDIWAEILIQAAEKYKMNLSSLSSLKEEQELLIENLLEEKSNSAIKIPSNLGSLTQLKTKETHFLNSIAFKASLAKMTPLMKFLNIYPVNPSSTIMYLSKLNFLTLQTNPYKFFISEAQLANVSSLKVETQLSTTLLQKKSVLDPWKRWAVNQYLTTQGRDTDLFMDIHPPKSFLNISFLKTYLPAQEILGSLVCDIYSGLFAHKVSKNILVVGAPGTAKSFFIQALAGETELKIVTDNAHRYAVVQGGVPIGMKLLRDVFDSIALHTPCLFLLEDIHVIGERRPMLISDDESAKATDATFGAEHEEVHEKNRLIYQLSRHSITHYKRPYKGDFSLSIPTNHFCYDLFLGISSPRKRRSGLTTKSPFPIVQLEKTLARTEATTPHEADSIFNDEKAHFSSSSTLLSSLQITSEQVFAPPATSPFNILLMKEQKKLKPRKFVKEIPWSGFSYDQFMLISKSHYSVRVKVALLAEMAMTNLSVKLDMITDLLVIIDSVRSNRGFVVFATTHVPSLLDPALRRPGRLDETVSLPLLPNLMSRFEIFKTSLSSYSRAVDLLDYSLLTAKAKQNENQIHSTISKSLLLLLNSQNSQIFNISQNLSNPPIFANFYNDYPIYSISQAFQTSINLSSSLLNTSQLQKCLHQSSKSSFKNFPGQSQVHSLGGQKSNLANLLNKNIPNIIFAGNDKLNYIALTYAQAGQFLVDSLIMKDQTSYTCKFLTSLNLPQENYNTEEQIFKTLYSSELESKNTLLKLFAGKITEFFVLNNSFSAQLITANSLSTPFSDNRTANLTSNRKYFNLDENSLHIKKDWWLTNNSLLQTNPSQSISFENLQNYQTYWQSATSFLESLYQKRYLYSKNTVVSKMLFFEDSSSLRQAPSPPNSSILMPAKKFENYKRTVKDFIQKPMLTINEKIQIHQKQRFLKLLYNIPVQGSFTTVSNKKNLNNGAQNRELTNFYNSFKELGYLDLMTLKPSSSYCFYKNRLLTRHRFSFLNQWWNGQLAEHTVETTYLSHVDWRSMFVQSLGDLVIDFPDADQYYNPRNRRWFLQSTSWNYWLNFDKNLRQEISQHYILYCFTKTSDLLNTHRELLDYLAFRFLRYHQLKEIDLLNILNRFHQTKKVFLS